jgi:hypothetical protein
LKLAAELDLSPPYPNLTLSRVRIDCGIARPAAGLPERPCRLARLRSLFLLFLQEIISGN